MYLVVACTWSNSIAVDELTWSINKYKKRDSLDESSIAKAVLFNVDTLQDGAQNEVYAQILRHTCHTDIWPDVLATSR